MFAFSLIYFFRCVLWLNDTYYSKVSEGTNTNLLTRSTLVQLLTLYTDPESHNAQHCRWTTWWSYCVALHSAKKTKCVYYEKINVFGDYFC